MPIKLVTWNLEWATPERARGRTLKERFDEEQPDVVVLTETVSDMMGGDGHTICSEPRPSQRGAPRRRKVLMWSRHPWRNVDADGEGTLTDGRFVRGVTDSPLGPIEVVGVCIPWSHSHVTNGRRDCKAWEDHLDYLAALGELLRSKASEYPRILAGDFNQRVPRTRQPARAYAALMGALTGFEVATAGRLDADDKRAIDHVALDYRLRARRVEVLSNYDGERRLTDHFGLSVSLDAG